MFFSISLEPDDRFPNNHQTNIGVVNLDNGWNQYKVGNNKIFYKGYVLGQTVEQLLEELSKDPTPRYQGNFCCIIVNDQVTVTHDIHRSFPLYYYDKLLTNLKFEQRDDHTRIYSDRYASLNQTFDLIDKSFDCYGVIVADTISVEECLSEISNILTFQFQNFTEKYKIFFSGGVDTGLLLALGKNQYTDIEQLDYEHFEYDPFTYKNITFIRHNHWGYIQLHHWRTPERIITGACGDEFFMRGPETVALWAAWHDINLVEELTKDPTCYHNHYFLQPKNKKVFEAAYNQRNQIKQDYPDISDLNKQILNINLNDHQHWHLGNTLTITPYKNLEITKLLLRLAPADLLGQILNANINRALICCFGSELLTVVSPYKNHNRFARLK